MKINSLILLSGFALILFSCKSEKQKLIEQIQTNQLKLFNDSTQMLDATAANNELEACKKFVALFPQDTASPSYLFIAADLAHGMKRTKESMQLYRQFVSSYPDHPKAASCVFLQAFMYDTELRQKDSAKIIYKEFLEKYPTHSLAASAKASLDQIETGMTDEELVKMFEARLDSSQKKAN